MSIYSLPPLMGSIAVIAIGTLVYIKNPKSQVNFSFGLCCLALFGWLFGYTIVYSIKNDVFASMATRFACGFAAFASPTFYHLSVSYTKTRDEKKLVYLAYLITFILFSLFISTNYIISTARKFFWGYYSQAGHFHNLYLIFFFGLFLRGLYLLFKHYLKQKRISQIKANRTIYIFISYLVALMGAVDYLQKYGVKLYPLGWIFEVVFAFIIAYAIIRHRLMDITIIIRKSIVYSIIIAILTGVYLSIILVFGEIFHILNRTNYILFSISSIFILAFAFQALKTRLQEYIDRSFFRERYLLNKHLQDIGKASISMVNLDQLLKFVAKSLFETLEAKHVQVLLQDKNKGLYKIGAAYPKAETTSISDNFYLAKKLKSSQKILVLEELYPQESPPAIMEEMKRLDCSLALPLVFNNSLIGIIMIGNKFENKFYSEEEIVLLSDLCVRLSIAIENALLTKQMLEIQKQVLEADKLKSLGAMTAKIAEEINSSFANELSPKINIEKLKRITDGLSRYGEATKPIKKLINLNSTLERTLFSFENVLQKKNIKKELHTEEIPLIEADENQIIQLFVNLIANAIEAMPNVGTLTVRCHSPRKLKVEIEISDTGIGIPKEALDKIFEPFYTTKPGNAGLGLAIAKKIIEEYKGSIEINSEIGKGTTVVVCF